MDFKIIHIDETDSTNRWLAMHEEADVAVADYQTAGRGCGSNAWESERGKNLTFSIRLRPKDIPAKRQFHISMAVSLAVCDALGQHIGDLAIKWPNDIYWRNGKIAGILIENVLKGSSIKESIIGIGLNVNQQTFRSDAPNPVSLWQICGQETDRMQLLDDILHGLEHRLYGDIRQPYLAMLYRRQGYHPYADKDGVFMAELEDVEEDGRLVLRDDQGQLRRYAFKEVQFII